MESERKTKGTMAWRGGYSKGIATESSAGSAELLTVTGNDEQAVRSAILICIRGDNGCAAALDDASPAGPLAEVTRRLHRRNIETAVRPKHESAAIEANRRSPGPIVGQMLKDHAQPCNEIQSQFKKIFRGSGLVDIPPSSDKLLWKHDGMTVVDIESFRSIIQCVSSTLSRIRIILFRRGTSCEKRIRQ